MKPPVHYYSVLLPLLLLSSLSYVQQQQQQQAPLPKVYRSTQLDDLNENVDIETSHSTTTSIPEEKVVTKPEIHSTTPEDVPLQLIRPDAQHKSLVIVEENLKYLHSITEPVSTIAVVGKYHSGKSFLMNQLMSKSAGFGIGSRVTPETMGIWLWGKPIESQHTTTKQDGAKWILLLDTEGFAANNISENYDAKIFAVATLLSSTLLYNSVKIIDQSDIDYLELLARRTQLFALKAQMTATVTKEAKNDQQAQKNWADDFSPQLLQFPSLVWVVQDFVQDTGDTESCRDWLLHMLGSHTRETESYIISLRDIFPSIDCHTLFIPSVRKQHLIDLSRATEQDLTEEYRTERDALIGKIKSEIKPKMKTDHKPFTGVEIAALLRILVNAANIGSLTDIPNRWDAFLEGLQKTSVDDCYKFYCTHFDNLLDAHAHGKPVRYDLLQRWHNVTYEKSFHLLSHLLHGLSHSLVKARAELDSKILLRYKLMYERNQQQITLHLINIQKVCELNISDTLSLLSLPLLRQEIVEVGDRLKRSIPKRFEELVDNLVDQSALEQNVQALQTAIQLNVDSTILRNTLNLENMFENITQFCLQQAFIGDSISIDIRNPASKKEFETLLVNEAKRMVNEFTIRSGRFVQETNIYENYLRKLKSGLSEKATLMIEDNEKAIAAHLARESQEFFLEFDRTTSVIAAHFPMDTDGLKKYLRTEEQKFYTAILADLSRYVDSDSYQVTLKQVQDGLRKISDTRESENLRAFRQEVEAPLALAKKNILLSSSMYSTLFTFRRFATSSCLLQLNEGKAKEWPEQLKMKIIETFLVDDVELNAEIRARHGIWSRIISFFQWFFSLFFG